MKTLITLVLFIGVALHAHAQGIVYFSYGAGIRVGDGLPITELPMDLDGNGTADFRFLGGNPLAGLGFTLEAQNQNKLLGYPTNPGDLAISDYGARRLNLGAVVSSVPAAGSDWFGKKPNPNTSNVGLYLISCFGDCGGDFARANSMQTEGYVGVQFFAADGLHYGWIRVRGGNSNDGRILDYAYNTVPGQGIAAGAVPEPSTWALLGVGFAALCLLRKRSSA